MADATELKTARTTLKGQFTRLEKKLNESLTPPPEGGQAVPIATIKRRFADLSEKWEKTQDAHDAYISVIAGTSSEAELETEEGWINDISSRFDLLEIAFDRHLETVEKTVAVAVLPPPAAQVTPPTQAQTNSLLKLERIKLAPFDGNIRKYPEFKITFQKHVEPQFDAGQRALVLRSHLVETVREEVANAGEDYVKLWERLDQKYGNVGKLVDAILFQIKNLPSSIADSHATLSMIKVVETAHRDLQQLKRETEMYNATTISMIEERLPSSIHQEWVKLVASKQLDSAAKFALLLELLGDWRCRLEYSSDSIRVTVDYQHQGSVNYMNYPNQNHNINNSLGRNDANGSTKRPLCWLHVSLGGGADHPIWRCRDFKGRSVVERTQLVQLFKACVSCLLQNCPGLTRPSECNSKFVCKINGCGKNHNNLLHIDDKPPLPVGPVPPPAQQMNSTTTPVQASGTDFSSTILPIQRL